MLPDISQLFGDRFVWINTINLEDFIKICRNELKVFGENPVTNLIYGAPKTSFSLYVLISLLGIFIWLYLDHQEEGSHEE